MSRFLFCSLDSPGFLYPAVGIARELQTRGHEAAFVTDIRFNRFLCDYNLDRLPFGQEDGSSFQVAQWFQPRSIVDQVRHIEHALGLFRADALIGQALTLGPLLVAERRTMPIGLLGFCTYLWPVSGEPLCNRKLSAAEARAAWRHGDMLKWFNQARSVFRLSPFQGGSRETPFLGDLFLLRNIAEFLPGSSRLPDRVHLVGSCLWEPDEPDPELESWLADVATAPLIYVQQGRSFHLPRFWPQLVEALGGRDLRIVWTSDRIDTETGALPDNVFLRHHVLQGRVLRNARAVVANANTTSVLGALAAGIPSLLVPGGGEQPDVAEHARALGTAITLRPEEATPERIAEALDELLSNSRYRERAIACGAALEKVDGFSRAADLLEVLAARGGPVLRSSSVLRVTASV